MTKEYNCADCGIKITIESRNEADFPKDDEKILCQKCDPAFAELLDNKHHRRAS